MAGAFCGSGTAQACARAAQKMSRRRGGREGEAEKEEGGGGEGGGAGGEKAAAENIALSRYRVRAELALRGPVLRCLRSFAHVVLGSVVILLFTLGRPLRKDLV